MSQCKKCSKNAAVFLPYSGEKLCRKCFLVSVEKRVQKAISRYKMLKRSDSIGVALSGGKDSVTLLHVLQKIEKNFPESKLTIIHIDEGISKYSEENLKVVKENASELDIPLILSSYKKIYGKTLDEIIKYAEKNENKRLGACSYCGVLRRKALNKAAYEANVNCIATAHNLDDEAQTVLLNILRGDLNRLARNNPIPRKIHPKLVPRIKPLRTIPEKETTLYAFYKNLKYNSKPCPYAPEAYRDDIRVFLNQMEKKRPGTKYNILRLYDKLIPQITIDKTALKECLICGDPSVEKICKPCQLLEKIT
ncbi:MAG: TIGR00269 family protein [Candidatus Jordarchaeaceae archaeon]